MLEHSIHTHSARLASGEEILVARVVTKDGKVGFGYSLSLDATAARHMAERNAGVRPGETTALPSEIERLIASLRWLAA